MLNLVRLRRDSFIEIDFIYTKQMLLSRIDVSFREIFIYRFDEMINHNTSVQFKKLLNTEGEETDLEVIEIQNVFCHAQICLQGGQILHYQAYKNEDLALLWLSEQNSFVPGKAIRGGIPLCFPWFGKHAEYADYPSHGFARNLNWEVVSVTFDEALGHQIILELTANEQTRRYWDYAFRLQMCLTCGEELTLVMQLSNLDQQAFAFNFAWHSYFAIADIHAIVIDGLSQTPFIDQLRGDTALLQEQANTSIQQETDRIYPKAGGHYQIFDQNRVISIDSPSCPSVVLWNPWIEKTQRLGDVAEDAWQKFVCLECGQIGETVQLAAGQTIQFQQTLSTSKR